MLRQVSFNQVIDTKLRKADCYLISHMFYLVSVLSRNTELNFLFHYGLKIVIFSGKAVNKSKQRTHTFP